MEVENESSSNEVLMEGDIVWGKAFPYTWWPGLIRKIDHFGVLISFFCCDIIQYCEESEMCSFEKNFQEMSAMMEGSLLAAVQCALVELCRRVARGLSCPCQGSVEGEKLRHPTKQIIQVKKSVQPMEVLDFVLSMAICTWVEDGEELTVTRRATQVIAFRRHSYIRKDWIYQATMRLSKSCSACDDSEANKSGYSQMQRWSYFDDDTIPSVIDESDFSNQETKHENFLQQAESDLAICSMNMADFSALGSDELESMCEDQAICRMNMDFSALGSDEKLETLCEDKSICTINMDFSSLDSDEGFKSLNENQVEDVNMLSSSMDDDFVFVEEGFEVENSAGVCARVQMNVEEMKKDRSGTEFCLDNGSIVSAFCCTNKEKKPSCRSNFQGHSDRAGLENFPARTLESIEPQNGSITGICREYEIIDDSEKNLATVIPKMDGKSAILDGPETVLLRTEFVDSFELNSCHDISINSDPLSKLCKIQSFSADASFRDASTEVETQLSNDCHLVEPPVRSWTLDCFSEEREKQPLREILTHLLCLALDPFHLSAGRTESERQSMLARLNFETETSISVCQVILKYRCLVYRNICSISELFSHNQEDGNKNGHACTGETTEGSGENLKVNCFSINIPEMHTIKPVSKKELPATEPTSKDSVGACLLIQIGKASEATGESQLLYSCTDDHINVLSCNTTVATFNITRKNVSLGTHSKNSSLRKRQHGCTVSSDSPLELPTSHPVFPLNRLCSSTLSMDTAVSNSNLLRPSSDDHSEVPTSLHLKFPKNFNIPSKVELIKKFRPFGPLDYLRTRIFLYTGAAEVVFLHHLDAVAAYRFSKRKRLFGQTNVLSWLDRHERARRKINMPAQLSLSGVGTSALNLKSCLKASNSHVKSNKRRPLRVNFVLEKENISSATTVAGKENISSATTVEGKNTHFTDPPCYVWENTRQDISQKMLMLLEECNQLVCQIKDDFGLESYYSIFT